MPTANRRLTTCDKKILELKDPNKNMLIIHCKIFPPMQRKPLHRRIYSSPRHIANAMLPAVFCYL